MRKKRTGNTVFLLRLICWGILLSGTGLNGYAQSQTGSNDHIFPASPVAKLFIDFDKKGFIINGRREFLVSAGIEYARMPHELWHDRLLRLQRAGFNCVEIYTFWNYHEPREGQFDFSGDKDLNGFLRLVKKMGMYAIVRVGPYYCAEWDNGGYPLWLRFKEGVRVREDNPAFEKYTDRFFDRLLPIVMSNQIHRGGSVILVQLENEHIEGWGTAMPNGYFRHLRDKALSLGLEVPYFFSGLHHSNDPAGNRPGDPVDPTAGVAPANAGGAGGGGGVAEPAIGIPVAGTPDSKPLHGDGKAGGDPMALDDPSRPNPWFSTEFWSVWFSGYSSGKKEALDWGRRTWKIIAHGGGGYNYYMAYGGSNFGYTNNDEDAASYDYGAAVGQAGDLRPIYYEFKRAALFARSFREILANSRDATAKYAGFLEGSSLDVLSGDGITTPVRLTVRQSPAGDLFFLDNPTSAAVKLSLPSFPPLSVVRNISPTAKSMLLPNTTVRLEPGEILPVVSHYHIDTNILLDWAPVRIAGIAAQGATTTIVVEGSPGDTAHIRFYVKGGEAETSTSMHVAEPPGKESFSAGEWEESGYRLSLHAIFPFDGPDEYSFRKSGHKVRILLVSHSVAKRTWFIPKKKETVVVCGPEYAGDTAGHRLFVERTNSNSAYLPVWAFDGKKSFELAQSNQQKTRPIDSRRTTSLPLSAWRIIAGVEAASPHYDDSKWLHSEIPLQMGADGDLSPDAWYRTTIRVPDAGLYTLQVEGSDRAMVFVDGKKTGNGTIRSGEFSFPLQAGSHQLSIFVAHDGRDKLAAYMGRIDSSDRKGLFGEAVLKKGGPSIHTVSGWHFLKAASAEDVSEFPIAGLSGSGWKPYTIGDDAFGLKQGFGWFRATLDSLPAGVQKIALSFRSVDEDATVFINGHLIGSHRGWNSPFRLMAGSIDTIHGPVELTVFIENHSNEGGIDQQVRFNSVGDGIPVTGWAMRGGTGKAEVTGGLTEARSDKMDRSEVVGDGPRFLTCHFQAPAYGPGNVSYLADGPHPIWRVLTDGLGHGSVWVNGHNLGRYPEKTPAPGLYIPECWLKAGDNELVIFEEDGNGPEKVSVRTEEAASREVEMLTGF